MTNSNEQQLSFLSPKQPPVSLDAQRLNLIALSKVKGLGVESLKVLIDKYLDLGLVWEVSLSELKNTAAEARLNLPQSAFNSILHDRNALEESAKRILESFDRQDIHLITSRDDDYPKRLLGIVDPPRWLFVHGNPSVLSMPNLVAVVGTREASLQGIEKAKQLSQWLGEKGFGIVAGLAEGIDHAAHQTALDYGIPTVAVLGTGILVVFPATTSHIRKQIVADGGAVITEYLPNDSYSRTRFIKRNRIQAGLAYATVPVEAAERSGTTHTYNFARRFGRVIFGVIRSSGPEENGILELLRKDQCPIFDLDSEESLRDLEELLKPALFGAPSTPHRSHIFKALIQEFERVVNSYEVTQQEFENLKASLDQALKESRRGGKSRSS